MIENTVNPPPVQEIITTNLESVEKENPPFIYQITPQTTSTELENANPENPPSVQQSTILKSFSLVLQIPTIRTIPPVQQVPINRPTPRVQQAPTLNCFSLVQQIPTTRNIPPVEQIPTIRTIPPVQQISPARIENSKVVNPAPVAERLIAPNPVFKCEFLDLVTARAFEDFNMEIGVKQIEEYMVHTITVLTNNDSKHSAWAQYRQHQSEILLVAKIASFSCGFKRVDINAKYNIFFSRNIFQAG